jgi:type VI secretion system secreted protein VgrG
MAASGAMTAILENRKLKMSGPLPDTKMFIKAARVIEGLSTISEATIDFMSHDRDIDLAVLVGQTHKIRVQIGEGGSGGGSSSSSASGSSASSSASSSSASSSPAGGGGTWREFVGTCVEAEFVGLHEGYSFFTLEIRPWLWFLTKTSNNRIFQNVSAVDIIKKIFSDRGFSDYTINTSRTPDPRIYTVQYNETDFDFISRLMEEEGMYYFSTVTGGKDMLSIVDSAGAHQPVPGAATIEFKMREPGYRRSEDHIFEWRGGEAVRSGKVTLRDYNFETPRADKTTAKALPKGNHSHKNYEQFKYPGHYRENALGDIYSRIKMEAEAVPHALRDGIANVRTIATGATFTLSGHSRSSDNQQYLITSGVHMMQIEVQEEDETQQVQNQTGARKGGGGQAAPDLPGTIKFDEKNKDSYRCTFQSVPKTVPFRAPLTTEWPKIPGILLAKVTGPSGEEIYTDKYGRIKVQFPWDREGKNDENTTCWVRVVTPWSGKNWGMIAVPRIGQEVVIQFEDGDPDRPICTGMLYNADVMPPYALPANMTQTGIKTRSSKGGAEANYNELVFEDKKDEEFIRFHSEKDFFHTVENNAVVKIGMDKKDPGDTTTDIYNSRTETIHKGDLTLTVATGNEKRDIKTDRTEKIGQHATQEVKGNKTMKVTGNYEGSTGGNSKTEVTGNTEESITGTQKTTVTGGLTIESPASIELKVGGNSIKIDPSGVTINGIMIKTKASAMAEHDGGGMMVVKGGIVMIN